VNVLILIVTVLLTSAVSGTLGMGGGIILLAVMASTLDPALVVPIHGIIQLVSNVTRTLALLRSVAWRVFFLWVPGLFLGAWLGVRLYSGAGMPWFRPLIGAFVIAFLLWDRFKPKRLAIPMWAFLPGGIAGGVLTIVLGATGPYLATFFLRDDLERKEVVATKSACQTIGHLVKIPAFLYVGFSYADHLRLITPLLACAIAGTFIGTSFLRRMNEAVFRVLFRIVLLALAARLLADAW
jgi:uncharacterized membrane protein YfcA